MANLGPQLIKNSYQDLVQITASNALAKGDGTSISNISVTSSWAINALSASFLTPTGNTFVQGGNSFGTTALLGTNDTQDLQLETSGSVRVHISSSGNVGIGTATPVHNLVVNGSTGVSINANGATFPNIHRDSTDGGMLLRSWNGSTFTNNVKITPTSNVGIGTTSPTQRLDVRDGFIQVSGSGASGYGYLLNRAGQDTYSIRHLDGGLTINNETDSVKEMTFLGNGNVGINKINPSARLEIRGSGATSATTAFRVENSNQNASLVVLDDGNVGIGTTNPIVRLHLSQSSGVFQRVDINNANADGVNATTQYYTNTGATPDLFGATSFRLQGGTTDAFKQFQVYIANLTSPRFIINGSGNVGINTTSPNARLHISGANNEALLIASSSTAPSALFVSGSGNVGIGTTTPQRRLHIDASGSANTDIPLLLTSVDANNRVGIRFASSSLSAGRQHSLFNRVSTPTAEWLLGTNAGETAQWNFIPRDDTNYAITLRTPFNGGTAQIATGLSQSLFSLGAGGTGNQHLNISSSGNVGIGTATPSTTLQVAGTSSLQNIIFDTDNTYDIGTITTRARNIWSNGLVIGIISYFNSAVMYNSARIGGEHTATALLHISGSDSAQMMRINSPTNANILFVSGSGNVGIGTSNPLSRLHVSGSDGNEFFRITSGSQNILNVRSGSAVFFAGTGVAPSSGVDLDIQGTGTANGGSVRIAGNGTAWAFGSVSSVNRGGTGNSDMFNVSMTGTSATLVQNPMSITFNAQQNAASGSGYTVLRVNATHATTAGTGSKLLQTWEFGGTQRSVVNITGSIGVGITTPSASVHISSSLGLAPILAITPHHPLPTTNIPTGSFMVSSSIPPKPFFWDGTTWNALY